MMMRGIERERKSTSSSSSNSREKVVVLAIEIVEDEILCRLPVKSLLRCKSVCKLWYSLIQNSTPKFIKTHHHHQNHSPLFVDIYLSVLNQVPMAFNPSAKKYYSFWPNPLVVNQNQNQNRGDLVLFSYYLGLPRPGIFLRPVNGVSLILPPNNTADRCRMALFNPATRQFCKLSIGDFKFNTLAKPTERYKYNQNHIFGFGICSSNKYTSTSITSLPHHDFVYKGLVHIAMKMPMNAQAHFTLGLMYQRMGQPLKAVSATRRQKKSCFVDA